MVLTEKQPLAAKGGNLRFRTTACAGSTRPRKARSNTCSLGRTWTTGGRTGSRAKAAVTGQVVTASSIRRDDLQFHPPVLTNQTTDEDQCRRKLPIAEKSRPYLTQRGQVTPVREIDPEHHHVVE